MIEDIIAAIQIILLLVMIALLLASALYCISTF